MSEPGIKATEIQQVKATRCLSTSCDTDCRHNQTLANRYTDHEGTQRFHTGLFISCCSHCAAQSPGGCRESLLHIISCSPLAVRCAVGTLHITKSQSLAQHQTEKCFARDSCLPVIPLYLHRFKAEEMGISQEQCNPTMKARAGG